MKRIRGKKLPLTAAGLHALRDEYTRTIEPAHALAAEFMAARDEPDACAGSQALPPFVKQPIIGSNSKATMVQVALVDVWRRRFPCDKPRALSRSKTILGATVLIKDIS